MLPLRKYIMKTISKTDQHFLCLLAGFIIIILIMLSSKYQYVKSLAGPHDMVIPSNLDSADDKTKWYTTVQQ